MVSGDEAAELQRTQGDAAVKAEALKMVEAAPAGHMDAAAAMDIDSGAGDAEAHGDTTMHDQPPDDGPQSKAVPQDSNHHDDHHGQDLEKLAERQESDER